MQEQHGADVRVMHQISSNSLVGDREYASESQSMKLEHRSQDLVGCLFKPRIRELRELGKELLDPRKSLFEAACAGRLHAHLCAPKVGACCTSSSLPPPRYMCTPQGRHGSKLRTVRMMSTPLNFSRPFSSNSGMFWMASS